MRRLNVAKDCSHNTSLNSALKVFYKVKEVCTRADDFYKNVNKKAIHNL